MILAEQMQYAMHHKMAEMVGRPLALLPGLAGQGLAGDQDVAKQQRSLAVSGHPGHPGRFSHGEGQHVGRLVDAPVVPVMAAQRGVVRQHQADHGVARRKCILGRARIGCGGQGGFRCPAR